MTGMKELKKELAKYIAANVCGMIGLSCYILADTFFIANAIGANGLTALNLALPIYSMVHGSGLMLGMGGATRFSIARGQNQQRMADQIFSQTVILYGIFGVIFVLSGLFLSATFAGWLGANAEVFEMTRVYLQVILFFAPAFMLNDIFVCFVRNDGAPRQAMCAMLLGSFSNIVLDYIFMYPLHMGIFGAVLATGCAPIVGIWASHGHWKKKDCGFHFRKTRPEGKIFRGILALGVPSLITELASGVVMFVFNLLILNLEGNTGVAAYGVVANLAYVVTAIHTGIAQGTQPLISREYGRQKEDHMKKLLELAMLVMAISSVLIYLIFYLGADPLTAAFNSEGSQTLQKIAVHGMRLYFTGIWFAGFNIILAVYFMAQERAMPAQILSLARGFFVIVPVAVILAKGFGMTGVWISYAAAEGIVAILGVILYKKKNGFQKKAASGII